MMHTQTYTANELSFSIGIITLIVSTPVTIANNYAITRWHFYSYAELQRYWASTFWTDLVLPELGHVPIGHLKIPDAI